MKAFITRALVCALPWAIPWAVTAQVSVLQIKVIEGEGGVHPAGARVAHPITVEVTDEAGKPVAGAAVSFQLPPDGPSGLFSNGLRTDLALTDSNGHASLHAMQLNRTAGQFRMRITAVKEQARAGIVSMQYIGEAGAQTATATAKNGAAPTAPEQKAGTSERSASITPTTGKVGPRISKKWMILAALAVGAGAAVVGASRASNGSKSGSPSSGTISIGTPTITIGSPNP